MTTYTDNGHGNWVDAMPICEPVSMIMEAAALLVDDMTSTLYKIKAMVSKTSHKAWRQLLIEICSICPCYVWYIHSMNYKFIQYIQLRHSTITLVIWICMCTEMDRIDQSGPNRANVDRIELRWTKMLHWCASIFRYYIDLYQIIIFI